jgi:hypothetical protein
MSDSLPLSEFSQFKFHNGGRIQKLQNKFGILDELVDTVVTGAATVVHGCVLHAISAISEPEQGIAVVEHALFLLLIPLPHCLLQDVHGPQTLHFA